MKYIIIDYSLPIIFSEGHSHDDFLAINGTITSAGFCKVDSGMYVVVYGCSTSLGLHPDLENDERILNKLVGLNRD